MEPPSIPRLDPDRIAFVRNLVSTYRFPKQKSDKGPALYKDFVPEFMIMHPGASRKVAESAFEINIRRAAVEGLFYKVAIQELDTIKFPDDIEALIQEELKVCSSAEAEAFWRGGEKKLPDHVAYNVISEVRPVTDTKPTAVKGLGMALPVRLSAPTCTSAEVPSPPEVRPVTDSRVETSAAKDLEMTLPVRLSAPGGSSAKGHAESAKKSDDASKVSPPVQSRAAPPSTIADVASQIIPATNRQTALLGLYTALLPLVASQKGYAEFQKMITPFLSLQEMTTEVTEGFVKAALPVVGSADEAHLRRVWGEYSSTIARLDKEEAK